MKSLWVAIVSVTILVGIVVAGELYTRSTDEVVTFAQLPASFQEIPVYPNAQGFWRGAVQENIAGHSTTRITTFTTSDSFNKVMDFYRTTLGSSGWRYDTHGDVILSCDPFTFYNGDFYINVQDDHVWVAAKNVGENTEYQISKVAGSFWQSGLCP
jgi:hypothetical protein